MTLYRRSDAPKALNVRLMGRIEGCTNPESAELLPDGEHFVFGNCAMMTGHLAYRNGEGLVYLKDQAFISQGRISDKGDVTLTARHFITGLTGTLGIDILPFATKQFPAGAAFIAEGGNPIVIPGADTLYRDAKPRVLAFDPLTGKIFGSLPLDGSSPLGKRYNRFDQPNGLAIDQSGTLYVGDIPNGNPKQALPSPVPSAIYRIPHATIDGLATRHPAAAREVQRIEMPDWVNGLAASPNEEVVFAVSCSAHNSTGGSIYRIGPSDFALDRLPSPLISGIGLFLDGVGCSRRGTLFTSTPLTGDVHAFTPDGGHRVLTVDGNNIVRMPADFNVCYPAALKGEPALLVTDISVGCAPGDASVAVVDISGL